MRLSHKVRKGMKEANDHKDKRETLIGETGPGAVSEALETKTRSGKRRVSQRSSLFITEYVYRSTNHCV